MTIDAIAAVLIGLAVLDWIATVILVVAARHRHETALTERAVMSLVLSLGASSVAALSFIRLLRITIEPGPNLALLVIGLLAISVPQLVWVVLFLAGRFR